MLNREQFAEAIVPDTGFFGFGGADSHSDGDEKEENG